MKSEKPFVFLANKGFRNLEDRGGTQYLIKAFIEEFTKEENVELLVKINPAYGIPNVEQILKDLGYNEDGPKIIFDVNNYNYSDLVKLYNNSDVFVCPTRAESFGIPMIEAMACGKPVITTDFGGQTDFVDNTNGWIISGELEEVKHELQYEGIKWLTPNIEELKLKLRTATQSNLKSRKEEAIKTANNFTWQKTAKKIVELI